MFGKLQNKILLLNMALISVVMLSAFAAVYLFTRRSIQSENRRIMDTQVPISVSYHMQTYENQVESVTPYQTEPGFIPPRITESEYGATVRRLHQLSPDYALSFSADIDEYGNILAVNTIVSLPEETYTEAVRMAVRKNRNDGLITLNGRKWLYRFDYLSDAQMSDLGIPAAQNSRKVLFLDVTETELALRTLLLTLTAVGAAVLAAFYFISRYFSRRAVRPVIKAWEQQKQFIADASHELKTPLTIINANCDALLENERETVASQRKWIEYIQAGTDRMANLVGKLLTLAQMDGANLLAEHENVDMSGLVLDSVQALEAMTDKKGLECTHEIEPGIILKGDRERIYAVIAVLLENAVKYAGSYIDVKLVGEKRRMRLTVKNDGRGISNDEMPRIFDRFYRGDKSREGNDSYGLGLSIAKTVVENMGGKINAESEAGEYTAFTVTFSASG